MTAPRRLQLRRGNATAISTYVGAPGELIINTTDNTLRIHDGTTVGGITATVNTAAITDTLNGILNGSGQFANLIPEINSTYTLGNSAQQWRTAYVSDAIYLGGATVTVSGGNLLINGQLIQGGTNYGNVQVATFLTTYTGNIAALITANTAMRSYVDGQISAANAGVVSANLGMRGYVDSVNNQANLALKGYVDNLIVGAGNYSNVNVAAYLTTFGYAINSAVTLANTIQANQIAQANLGIKGYIDSQSFYSNTKVTTYLASGSTNIGNLWVDSITSTPDVWLRTRQNNNIYISPDDINAVFVPTQVSGSQTSLAGWGIGGTGVYSSNSYVQLDGYSWNSGIEVRTSWNNANHTWTFDNRGNLALPSGAQIGDVYGDGAAYTSLQSAAGGYMLLASNNKQQYVQVDDGGIYIGTDWPTHNYTWTFDKQGNLTLPTVLNGDTTIGTAWNTNPPGHTLTLKHNGGVNYGSGGELKFDYGNVKLKVVQDAGITQTWTFGADGKLTVPEVIQGSSPNNFVDLLPNDVTFAGNANVVLGSDWGTSHTGQTKQWVFDYNGNITFPDGSIQSTAFSNAKVTTYLAGTTSQTFGGNVTIQGNLIVNGTTSYISTNNLVIDDNIVNYANANPADSLDLGFVAHRTPSGRPLQHTGLVRDAANNIWKLFSNVVPSPGNTVDFTNAVYDDLRVGNITSPTITALTANAATQSDLIIAINANIALANTIQSNQLSAANTAITTANTAMKGYVDNAVSTANVGLKGYVDQANTTLKSYVDGQILAANTASYANTKVATYLQYGNPSNISVAGNVTATYFIGNGALLTGVATGSSYSNVQVATYLPTYTGNISAGNANIAGNLTVGSYISTSGTGGNISGVNYYLGNTALITSNVYVTAGNVTAQYFIGNGSQLTGLPSSYSNINAASYLITNGYINTNSAYGNANTASYLITNGYVNTNSAYANSNVASYLITNQYITAGSAYGNGNVASYLPTYTGNVGGAGFVGTTANIQLITNAYITTYDTLGNVAFGNAAYPVKISAAGDISTAGYLFGNGAFLTGIVASSGGTNYSDSNVISYLSGASSVIVGNTNPYSIQSNNTTLLIGSNTAITNGGGTNVGATYILNNVYFDGNGQARVRNTSGGGLSYFTMQGGTLYFQAASGSVTANATTAPGTVFQASTGGFSTVNSINITSAGNISAALGGFITSSVQGYLFNTTANVIYLGGAATQINAGAANVNLRVGSGTGNVTAGYFIGSGQFLTSLPGYAYSNANVAAYLPTYGGNITAQNITVSGNINLTGNILQINSAVFYGNTITGFNALYAGIPGYTTVPQVVAQFTENFNGYAQLNTQNINSGNQSSSDYIATANNGNDSTFFVDLGIAGSGYDPAVAGQNNALGTVLSANDAYLYVAGNLATQSGGNLAIGTQTANKTVKIFAGGVNASNVVLTIANTGITTSNVTADYYLGSGQFLSALPGYAYSNVNVQTYTETMGFANYSNVNTAAYLNSLGYNLYSNVNVIAYLAGNITAGNVTATYFTGNGAFLTGLPAGYSNVQVAAYLNTQGYNLYSNVNTKAYTESIGLTNYSNVNVKAYTETMGLTNYSNVNVASYLSTATINTTGNITAAYVTGNISITGNVTGTQPNVTIQAGAYTSVFDNQGNVTVPRLFANGNIQTTGYIFGNGAFLTGIVTSGGGSGTNYSNVNVQAYTETMGFTNYSNVNVIAYLAGSITTGNIATNQTTLNLVNTTATTINFGGAATTVGIGASTGTTTVNNALTVIGALSRTGAISATAWGTSGAGFKLPAAQYTDTSSSGTQGTLTAIHAINGPTIAASSSTTYANLATLYIGNAPALGTNASATNRYALYVNQGAYFASTNTSNSTTTGGLIVAGGIGVAGNIYAGGNVTATYFIGDGSQLTGLPSSYSNVQVASYLPTYTGNISAGNANIAGNLTVGSYISTSGTGGNISGVNFYLGNLAILTGNITAAYYIGSGIYLSALPGYAYSNVNVAAYLTTNGYINTNSAYGNGNVASYLPTYSGNIANIRLGVSGVLTFADGTTQTTASAGGGSNYGNGNVASYLITNAYVNTNSAYGNGNTASYLITNGYVNTNSAYGNGNVTSYLPTHSGNVGVNNLIGTTPNVTLVANSYSTTYDIYGNVAFGNALYPVQVYATGNISTSGYLYGNGAFLTGIVASGSSYSNVQVAAYLAVTQTAIANVKLNPSGNIVFADGTTQTTAAVNNNYGNTNVKAYTETMGFQNYGNVNVASYLGAQGITAYSNVQVATYLPSYTGNVQSANLTSNTISVQSYIDFDLKATQPAYKEGRLFYDAAEETLVLWGDSANVEISIGQREWVRCRNSTANTIPKGSPVYVTGVHIPGHPVHGHHPTIDLADASDVNKKDVIGITGEDILPSAHGYVIVRGYIEGLNTANLTAGKRAHLGFDPAGSISTIAPEYPNYPMDLGICLTSNATVGTFYVDIFDHSFERMRVEQGAYVDGDLTVGGNLEVLGIDNVLTVKNLQVQDSWTYLAIGNIATTFSGVGLGDGVFRGHYTGGNNIVISVRIDSEGVPDTIKWSIDNFSTLEGSNVAIAKGEDLYLRDGVSIRFSANTGHTLNDTWTANIITRNSDFGVISNYVKNGQYTHAGLFRDASADKFRFFNSYNSEIYGNIDITDGSFAHADLEVGVMTASQFIGDGSQLTGITATSTLEVSQIDNGSNVSNIISGLTAIRFDESAGFRVTDVGGNAKVSFVSTAGNNYGNTNVQAYTQTMGYTNYSNVNVAAYLNTQGYNLYSNANVASYLPTYSGNLTAGNIVAAGNITAQQFVSTGSGTATLSATTNLDLSANTAVRVVGGGTFRLPQLTTANRDALIAANGDIIYNTSLGKFQTYESGAWANVVEGGGSGTYSNVNVAAYLSTNSYLTTTSANLSTYAYNANVTAANVGMKGYVDNQIAGVSGGSYGNTNVAAYLAGDVSTGNLTVYGAKGLYFANISGAATPAYGGMQTWRFFSQNAVSGGPGSWILFPDGSQQTTAYPGANTAGVSSLTLNGSISAGNVNITDATTSTSKTTGALTVAGGLGVAGTAYTNRSVVQGAYGNIILNEFTGIYNQKDSGTALIQTTTAALADGIGMQVAGTVGNTSQIYSTGNLDIKIGVTVRSEDTPTGGTVVAIVSSTGLTVTGSVSATGNITAGNVAATYFTGNGAFLTGLPTQYSNVNVATYLSGTSSVIVGNTNPLPLQANVTQVFVGNQLALYSGFSTTPTQATLSHNIYYDAAGAQRYRNTQTGAAQISMTGANGFQFQGTTSSTTANAASGIALWAQITSTGIVTYNSLGITAAGALTTSTGVLTTTATTGSVFNTSALTINMGGLATAFNVGASNVVATFGSGTGNIVAGSISGNLTGFGGNVYLAGNIIVGPTGYTVLPTTVAQFTGNANTYTQINLENLSSGSAATAEYVATANNGTDTTFFVDLGIANSNYDVNSPNNSLGTTIFPNDSYLYAQGNLATTTGGNLAIGTSTPNKSVKIFAGGINSANIVATVSNTGIAVNGFANITTASGSADSQLVLMGNVSRGGASYHDFLRVTSTASGITNPNKYLRLDGSGTLQILNSAYTAQLMTIADSGAVTIPGGNLTVNGTAGVITPNRPAFRVYGINSQIDQRSANVNLKSPATVVQFNQGSYYNNTTGIFTAPVAGIYSVGLNARLGGFNGLSQAAVLKNGQAGTGNVVCWWEADTNAGSAVHFGVNGTVVLAAGEWLSANIIGGNIQFDNQDNWHVTYLG